MSAHVHSCKEYSIFIFYFNYANVFEPRNVRLIGRRVKTRPNVSGWAPDLQRRRVERHCPSSM